MSARRAWQPPSAAVKKRQRTDDVLAYVDEAASESAAARRGAGGAAAASRAHAPQPAHVAPKVAQTRSLWTFEQLMLSKSILKGLH